MAPSGVDSAIIISSIVGCAPGAPGGPGHGARFGWRLTTLSDAVDQANQGCPVVASWANTGGIGHIAMIRPGIATAAEGPWMAQAGATNANYIRMYKVFRKSAKVEPWVHA